MTKIFGLEGKIALVTGASSGLGRHFAVILAGAGAKVAIGARRREKLAETADLIGHETGSEVCSVELDVTSPELHRALAMALRQMGRATEANAAEARAQELPERRAGLTE